MKCTLHPFSSILFLLSVTPLNFDPYNLGYKYKCTFLVKGFSYPGYILIPFTRSFTSSKEYAQGEYRNILFKFKRNQLTHKLNTYS